MRLVALSHLLKLQRKVFLLDLKQPDKKCGIDLRKNPNDLPEIYMGVLNQNGKNVVYDYTNKVWRDDNAIEYICEDPIAWCEIPTFEE